MTRQDERNDSEAGREMVVGHPRARREWASFRSDEPEAAKGNAWGDLRDTNGDAKEEEEKDEGERGKYGCKVGFGLGP